MRGGQGDRVTPEPAPDGAGQLLKPWPAPPGWPPPDRQYSQRQVAEIEGRTDNFRRDARRLGMTVPAYIQARTEGRWKRDRTDGRANFYRPST